MRAATDWMKYDPQSIASPQVGEWALWSVVTKHGREYYSGSLITGPHSWPQLFSDSTMLLPLDGNTYFARVVRMPEEMQ